MKLKSPGNTFQMIACFVFIACILSACGSSKTAKTDFLYFQNNPDMLIAQQKEMQIQPNDQLGIQVYSKTLNQDQVIIFNPPATVAGTGQGYQVSKDGTIDFPVLGSINVVGLTKKQLQVFLEQKLTTNVKNPTVLVTFLQFNVNVLGQVSSPGTKKFTTDKVTIIDAISAAGDLNEFADRQDILVIREENGKKIFHTVDLRNTSVFQSPVYILQPNDIIYVAPTEMKLKQLSVDPEKQRKLNLALALTSTGLGILAIILSILR